MTPRDARLAAFEEDRLDPASFDHRAHVEIAAALLAQTDFLDAARRYHRGLERLAARAGAPGKANLTITLAFLALIQERRGPLVPVETHDEVFDRKLLSRWYSRGRLADPAARTAFLMPDRVP